MGERSDRLDDLRTNLEAPLAEIGIDLFDIIRNGTDRATVIQVIVDRPGGVDLEAVTDATRVISPLLDAWGRLDGAYTLEVSSPGLERPLRRPNHFTGAIGMTVAIRSRDEAGVAQRDRGVLISADDEGCTIDSDGAPKTFTYNRIEQARTIFEWGPAEKPGKGTKPGRPKKEMSPQ